MPKKGYIHFCQYPKCSMRAVTEVGLTNTPGRGKYPKGNWIALCKKHREIIDSIRIELWRKIPWQLPKRVNIYQTTLHNAGQYGIGEEEVKDQYNARFNMIYNGKEI